MCVCVCVCVCVYVCVCACVCVCVGGWMCARVFIWSNRRVVTGFVHKRIEIREYSVECYSSHPIQNRYSFLFFS